MLYVYVGIVEEVRDARQVGKTRPFMKRDMIVGNDIEDRSKFENHICFSFMRDKCGLLDRIRRGDRVKVVFAINGRKWDVPKGEQFFTDLIGIGVYPANGAQDGCQHPSQSGNYGRSQICDLSDGEMPF